MTRVFDLVASVVGLLILSPVLGLVALFVRLSDGGPALFVQTRVGRGGRPFRMLKFRSMTVGGGGPGITVGGDARVTRIGRLLRATKLDEFPQLWNVARGEMSLVGPRPELETYVQLYRPDQRAVLALKPGITDPASFVFYDEAALLARQPDPEGFYENVLIGEKIRINLAYATQRTLAKDLLLIVATVLKPFGVHVDVCRAFGIAKPEIGAV